MSEKERCRLYLISPPAIHLPDFIGEVRQAFSGGDIGCFQLRLKGADDADILKASREIIPICHDHGAAFILYDRPDLALKSRADGVHLGQDDGTVKAARSLLGIDGVVGVSCHDSRHLAMVAGEEGADYVAFGAFYPTKSKSPQALAKYGTPTPDILEWWQTEMLLPCVALGGLNPGNCAALVKAGADFIAVITAVWEHPEGPAAAVKEFNNAIEKVSV